MERLGTVRGKALYKTMIEAREAFDEVYERYQHTLGAATNTNAGVQAVRQAGRAYAAALVRFSNASMEWLTYVDKHLRPKKAESADENH